MAVAETNWTAKFKAEQTSAADGMITVKASISGITSETGVICAIYNLHYDNDCLELVSWKNGLPSGWDFSGESTLGAEDWSVVMEDDGKNYFLYTLMNVEADGGVKDDGVLYTELQFKVLDENATEAELKFTGISLIDANDLENGTSLDIDEKILTVELNSADNEVSGDASSENASSEESVPEASVPEESVVSKPDEVPADPGKVVVDITLKNITDPAGVSSLLFHVKYDKTLLKYVEYSWIKPENWVDDINYTENMTPSAQTEGDLLFWVLNIDPACGVKEDGALGFRVTFELLGEEFKPEMLTIEQVEIYNSELQEMQEGTYAFSIANVSNGDNTINEEDDATLKIVIAVVAAVIVLGAAGFAWYWFGKKKRK
jgi:hypothetical protein